jgi:hypothetical protein
MGCLTLVLGISLEGPINMPNKYKKGIVGGGGGFDFKLFGISLGFKRRMKAIGKTVSSQFAKCLKMFRL